VLKKKWEKRGGGKGQPHMHRMFGKTFAMLSKQPSSGLCCCCCKIVFILQVARACCWLFLLSCFDGENFCVFLIRHENENALVVDFASEKLLTLKFSRAVRTANFSVGGVSGGIHFDD